MKTIPAFTLLLVMTVMPEPGGGAVSNGRGWARDCAPPGHDRPYDSECQPGHLTGRRMKVT